MSVTQQRKEYAEEHGVPCERKCDGCIASKQWSGTQLCDCSCHHETPPTADAPRPNTEHYRVTNGVGHECDTVPCECVVARTKSAYTLDELKSWLSCFEPWDEADPDEDAVEDGEKANALLAWIEEHQYDDKTQCPDCDAEFDAGVEAGTVCPRCHRGIVVQPV